MDFLNNSNFVLVLNSIFGIVLVFKLISITVLKIIDAFKRVQDA